jgi:hypothetical protein
MPIVTFEPVVPTIPVHIPALPVEVAVVPVDDVVVISVGNFGAGPAEGADEVTVGSVGAV